MITAGTVSMMALINVVIERADPRDLDIVTLILFVLAAAGVLVGQTLGQRISAHTVETMMNAIRQRIVSKTRRLEYSDFEAIGGTRIYDALTRKGALISEASVAVVPAYAAMGSLVLGGIYTVLLSSAVFGALAAIIVTSILFFRLNMRKARVAMGEASMAETAYLKTFKDLLGGFKEVRLHRPRGDDLQEGHLAPKSMALLMVRIRAAASTTTAGTVSLLFFYIMLGTICFILPPIVDDAAVIAQSIYVSVFLLSTVETILRSVPLVTRATFAMNDLESLEAELEQHGDSAKYGPERAEFETISLEKVTFNYRNSSGEPVATTGPVDLSIRRGETLFCVGGNGSGKSTFMKMLCRLYPPNSGTIRWDGALVDSGNASAYRALFSTVYSDFHLFGHLYGMTDIGEDTVNGLLAELGLGAKVSYANGAFSTTELSTGQRKRLAFAVAILEDRPIMVLDELSADQDPEFRDHFYRDWLPKLKAEGRTLIVVSHDDRYFGLADRIVTFRDGRIADAV